MRSLKIWPVAVSAVLLLLGTACGGETASSDDGVSDDEIVIGTTTAITGPIASACTPINNGSLAWFDHVNEEGGVDGKDIKNIVLDDGYDAAKALANARELAAEPVLAFFGGCGSLQPPAVVEVAEREKIPYLFASAGLPDIIPNPYVRTAYPLFADQLRGIVDWAMQQDGAGPAFVVNARQPGSDVTLQAAEDGAVAAGGSVAGTFTVNSGESDWSPIALRVKDAAPDYLVMHLTSADAARLVKALQDLDALPPHLIGTSVLLSEAFLGPVGTDVDGIIVTPANVAPPTSERADSCVEVLEAADVAIDQSSLAGCAFAQVMTVALEETEDLSRESLLETLDGWKDKEASELLPPLTFSDDQHIGMSSMDIVTVEDGQPVLVEGATFPLEIR